MRHLPSFIIAACTLASTPQHVWAAGSARPTVFLPTWKYLNQEEKEQFLVGYIQEGRDAEKKTSVVKDYVKDKPQKAVEGLSTIQQLCDFTTVTPDAFGKVIDNFYKDPKKGAAPLSKAVTAR